MPVESAADRAAFFDSDEFGDTAQIGWETFPGMLDNEYVEVGEVQSTSPVFICDESIAIAAGAEVDETITVTLTRTGVATEYKIREMHPDGTGLMMLQLEDQEES